MASEEKTSAAEILLECHEEVTSADDIFLECHEEVTYDDEILLECHEEVTYDAEFLVRSHEEVTYDAEFLVRSHEEVTYDAEFLVKNHEEVTSAASIPLESYQEFKFVPCTMAREEIQNVSCAADSHVHSFFEFESCRTSSTYQQIMDRSHEVSLNINEIATSLSKHLNTKKVFSRACCIYTVPARLRKLNKEAYTPRVVSIGPIHHGKENLKAMEDHKIMYLQQFVERSKVSVEDLINVVKDNETELRDCYSETIDLSREDFATMIILDAVFIIMVLLKFNNVGESNESLHGDQIFLRPFKFVDVVWDMCLLENQLPFFLLEKLFELYPIKNCTIKELTFELLKKIWANWVKEDSREKINSEVLHFVDFLRRCQQPTEHHSTEKINLSGVLHFVDLLRKCQQPREHHLPTKKTRFSSAPTAMKLHQSGVKFKNPEKNPERKSLFDIRFRHGTLEIPQLTIDDHTEILLRNLQAFEQCHHKLEDKFVSDYIAFIGFLVRAPNDVEVLADNKNLKNMLNTVEAVSDLVYNLDKENVVSEKSILGGVCQELTKHCKKPWHKWMANLKQVYFNNPWTAISVVAAAFLLVLTVIQTVCSILQL